MDVTIRDEFMAKWKKYFKSADLPIVFQYTDTADRALHTQADHGPPPLRHRGYHRRTQGQDARAG